MTVGLRLGLVLALLLVPPAARLGRQITASSEAAIAFDLSQAPLEFAGHRAVHAFTLRPEDFALITPDAYLWKLYEAPDLPVAEVYVAFYTGYGEKDAHSPELCLPAAGWEITGTRRHDLDLGEGESLSAEWMDARHERGQELVLYWFQPARRWPRAFPVEPLLRAVDRYAGRPQYAFVRVNILADEAASPSAAEAQLARLARKVAPWVRAQLDAEPDAR